MSNRRDIPGRTRDRERSSPIDPADLKALRDVGTFRVVDRTDLGYANVTRMVRNGSLIRKTLYPKGGGKPQEIISLSEKGRDELRQNSPPGNRQRYWVGSVKPREANHDMAIYRAYKEEAKAIEKAGGSIKRVMVDFEFKSKINREMNAPGPRTKAERRKELAAKFELPIIDETLMLPDARIEYLDKAGEEKHLDLEVMTKHYKGAMRSGKERSGFKLHRANDGTRRAKVIDDHNQGFI